MKPNDLVTTGTLRFYEEHLPARARILDAGCGAGDLASKLKDAGHHVIGLDANETAVEKTRALGVEATQAEFIQFEAEPFDAIVFSFSLHHIFPLTDALGHAERLLVPSGLLIAEEFAWDEIDEATARWFYSMWSLLESCGVLTEEDDEHHHSHGDLPDDRPVPTTPREEWIEEHRHEPRLHKGKEMLDGIERRFELVGSEKIPTLFTDFAVASEPSQRGYDIAFKLQELESNLIDDRTLVPLGLRIVARRRS